MRRLGNAVGRLLVNLPCRLLFHHLQWLPIVNRSALLTCPVAWACRHWVWFRNWYWEQV
jgi:hypothetical protein